MIQVYHDIDENRIMKVQYFAKSLIACIASLVVFAVILVLTNLDIEKYFWILRIAIPLVMLCLIWLMRNIFFWIYFESGLKLKGFKFSFWTFAVGLMVLLSGLISQTFYPEISSSMVTVGLILTTITFLNFTRYMIKILA
ncbi:MAG: hypothetical protein KKE39_01630 [Bacteroidetes bacterium]|nr:hypothetical protein [Bacteroidota bacterium]MBU1760370.1 hypothetical protein [Bacteroidota bacterium]MBU2377218.1 hypothetical protein [Bacteroidota bacterium]